MARDLYYRQCRLRKSIDGVVWEQMSYIPEPFCKVGRTIKLRDNTGTWDDGWSVVTAGARRPAHAVEDHSRDHLKFRKAGGDTD